MRANKSPDNGLTTVPRGLCGGLVLAAFALGGLCGAVWADDPPEKKSPPSTQQKAPESKPKEAPKGKADGDAGSEAAMAMAKRAAMESIGKGAPKDPPKKEPAKKPSPPRGGRQKNAKDSPPAGKTGTAATGRQRTSPAARKGAQNRAGNQAKGDDKPKTPSRRPARRIQKKTEPRTPAPDRGKSAAEPTRSGSRSGRPPSGRRTPSAREASASAEPNTPAPAPIANTTTTMRIYEWTTTTSAPHERTYRFDYFDTPWMSVLDDFSRVSGLSWLHDPDPPLTGKLTFKSPRTFTYEEAMHQLNELLLAPPLDKHLIRRRDDYLEIRRLVDWMRDIPHGMMFGSFAEMDAANPDEFDITLVYMDLPENWTGYDIIEEFRHMFSDSYGAQVKGDKVELTGLVREHRRWRNVIQTLVSIGPGEGPADPDTRKTVIVPLQSIRVSDAQTILKQLFRVTASPAGGKTRGRGGPGVDRNQDRASRIDVIANLKDNSLIIKASPRKMAEVTDMIAKLDSGDRIKPPVMKVIQLEHTEANKLLVVLKPIFQQQLSKLRGTGGGGKGGRGQPAGPGHVPHELLDPYDREIYAEPTTNSIIILGSAAGVASAEKMVKEWDRSDPNEVREIIELQHVKAEEIVGMLGSSGGRSAPRGRPGKGQPAVMQQSAKFGPLSSKKLLFVGPRRELEDIREMIALLDIPADDEAETHMVKILHARPSEIATTVQQLFSGSTMTRSPAARKGGKAPPAPRQSRGSGPRFIPLDDSGYLIVYCNEEDWERAEALIQELDEKALIGEPILRSFVLENADASDVVATLQQMFPPAPTGRGAQASREQIYANVLDNSVKVFAKSDFMEKVAPLIEQLDIPTTMPMTVIHLQHARAEEVAPILQQSFPGTVSAAPRRSGQKGKTAPRPRPTRGGSGVRIVAEPFTNSLLVTAPPKELERIQNLVSDIEAKAEPARLILYVENRPVNEVVEALQSLMGSGGAVRTTARKGGKQVSVGGRSGSLKIVPDGNRIILDGRQDEVAKAYQWFDEIDVVEQRPVTKKVYVQDAEEDAQKLRAMLGMGVSAPARPTKGGQKGRKPPVKRSATPSSIQIVPDPYENTLLIRAMPRDFIVIDELLTLIMGDAQYVEGTQDIIEPATDFLLYHLKHTTALDLGWTLEDLLNVEGQPSIQFDEGPDERTLLVRGCKPAQKETVEQYIEMFDVQSARFSLGEDMLVFDNDKLSAQQMIQMLKLRYNSPFGRSVDVVETGMTSGQVQWIDIHEGEEPAEAPPVVPVESVNPCVLPVSLLRSLQGAAAGQTVQANRPGGPADPTSCPICGQSPCALPAQLMQSVEAVALASYDEDPPVEPVEEERISEVEQETDPTGEPEPDASDSPASPASPAPSESDPPPAVHNHRTEPPVVRTAVADPGNGDSSPGTIKVFEDPFTGKLIIEVPEDERDFLERWISDLTGSKAPTVYRVFPLKYADVTAAGQLLNSIFNQAQTRQRRPRQPRQPQQQPGGKGAQANQKGGRQQQAPVAPAVPARIKVIPDPRTRSLFVAAPLPDVPLIIDLLRKIDSAIPPGERNIKFFRLVNLDATQVVENLREILGLNVSPVRRTPQQRGRGQRGRTPQQQQQQQQQMLQMQGQQGQGTLVSAEKVKLTAESQTNSIIAQGPPDTLDLIGTIIEKLETETNTSKIEMRRVVLKHARATEVAGIVQDVVGEIVTRPSGPAGQRRGGGRQGGGRRGGGVLVNADARTNSVILAGQVKDLDRVEGIVKELDIEDESSAGIRQFSVKGDPGTIADTLRTLFIGRGQQSDVVITANSATGMILVKAPTPLMVQIEEQLLAMDEKVEAEKARRPIKLEVADVEIVAENLQAIFGEGGRGGRRGAQQVTIRPNKSNSTLYVQCPDDLFPEIQQLARDMDKPPIGIQVKSIHLEHASAVDVQTKLERMLAQAARSGGMGDVKLDLIGMVADPRTNSLLVSGGPVTFLLLDEVIQKIDVELAASDKREMQAYVLPRTILAQDVHRNINELFRGEDPRKTGVERPTVTANAAGNIVTVIANASQHDKILKNIIKPIQQAVGDDLKDFLYQVKHARAVDLSNTLNSIIRGTKPNTRGKYPIWTFGDDGTNTLVINGTQAEYDALMTTIEALDVEGSAGRIMRTFTLTFAEPWQVPRIINEQFRNRQSRNPNDQVTASYINGTNSVVVSANEENMEKVALFIEEVDVPSLEKKITKFIKLKNARADALSNMLNQAVRASMPRPRNGIYDVSYGHEQNSNMLVVTAPEEQFAEIEARIAELDVEDGGRITRTFTVRYVAPWTMANILRGHFTRNSRNPNDQVVASFEDGTQSIIVTANASNMEDVVALIEATDKMPEHIAKETRFIQLNHARADELARTVTDSFRAKTVRNRQGQWPVTVTADVASNNLIVTAKMDMFEEIEQMVASLDVEQTGRIRRVFKMTYADPGSVSGMIQNMFRQIGRNAPPRDQVSSSGDWTTNSVIVTASEENMAEIESLIAELDLPGDALRTHHVIEVANSNARDVAQSLQQIFDAANRGRRGRASATIRAIQGTTKLAVYANTEEMQQIESLVRQIDVEGGRSVHTVTMPELVPARTVSENINKIYGAGRGGDGLRAEYHEPTNTLLVFATDAEFAKVNEQMIKVLIQQPTIGTLQIFKFPLRYAVADEVARTLQDFFDKKSGAKAQRNLPPWMRSASAAERLENQVSIIAEPTSNMLVVWCSETTKEMIEDLLKDIDTDEPIGGKKVMEMVTLEHMDATEMLEILTEYLKVSKRTPADQSGGSNWWSGGRRGRGQQEDKVILAGDMRLKAVESMNAIIVVGRPESVQDVLAKIKELDVEDALHADDPQRIALAHANASEMADVLNETFGETRRGGGGRESTQPPPIIVPEENTNSLIVKARPSQFSQIKRMVEELDAEMEGDTGIHTLQVPVGRRAADLAVLIEGQINDAEQVKQDKNRNHRPNKVTIKADAISNTLLVAGSKAQFEEVQRLIDDLIARGPAGGTSRRVIELKGLSSDQAKQLIEQLQQGTEGSSNSGRQRGRGNRRGGRGRRGDAGWTQHRRYEKFEKPETIKTVACATTLPGLCAQLMVSAALAQTASEQPSPRPREPVVTTIRPRSSATQPAPKGRAHPPAKAGGSSAKGAPQRLTPEQRIRATTQAAALPFRSDQAREAVQRRLTGAPIEVTTAGEDKIIIDANDEDMDVLLSILDMLDTAVPTKQIEYVQLVNSQAQDLARTLGDIFQKVEQKGTQTPGPEDKVDIIADPRTNGLFIAAVEEKMTAVLRLIEQIEQTDRPERDVRTFVMENRRVSEAGETLRKMVETFLRRTGRDSTQIGIEIDPQTNSIFVTGGANDIKFVEQIIEGLDAELPDPEEGEKKRPMGEADIMLVPLRVADAVSLGTLLNELLQKAATGDTPMKDFIRRMRLLDENGNPIAMIDLNRPIALFGDPDSNSLIIASSLENCLIMKQVAMAFDKEPARAEVVHKVLVLQYADATEVAEQLTTVLTESEALTQRPGKGDTFGLPDGATGALVFKAVVKPDPRTNQVVLVGRPESVEILEGLVKQLDVKGLEPMPIVIVKLEKASATALEQFLTDMMEQRAEAIPKGTGPNAEKFEKVVIRADPRSESLIIAARPARMEELRKLIGELDISASALVENIRTITLRQGNALELTEQLKDLWEQRKSQRDTGTGGIQLETPAIVADARSNSLIVAASPGDFEVIRAVVEKIESLELNPMANIYIVRLRYNSAQQLAPAFTTLFERRAEMRTLDGQVRPEDKVSIEVDEVSNSLLVAASRENYDVLMQKVEVLDQEFGVAGQIEFFVCDNVGAFRIKDTIDELFEGGVYAPGGVGDSQIAQDREKVTISVDQRANILIVSASPENMELVREIYARMNSVTTPWDAAITRLITIEYGDAVKIAAQIQDYFDKLGDIRESGGSGDSGGRSGAGFEITVFADERSNRIIVGGTKDGIDSAVEMIGRLDVKPGVPGQITEVYTLLEAPASTVGEMIDRIFQERNQTRSGATGAQVANINVTIEANDATNSLLINAAREDHILIADLIQRLDRPSTIIDMVQVFALERARAERVREILEELYQSTGGEGQGGRTIAVVEDARTNSVIVAAPPGELKNIKELVARLDETEVKGQAEIGIYTCENEDAEKMSELLNEIMTGQGGQGGGGTTETESRDIESMLVSFVAKDAVGRETLLKTIRENVQITHNVRTNSVIIVAPSSSLRLIEQLVRKLDRIQKRPVLVKVFQLINADATRMVQLLEDMFAYEEGSEQEREFQQGREMNVEGGLSSTGGVPSAMSQEGPTRGGTFGRPKTTFVADERTNSIISAGWPEDVDVVADIIDQLDSRTIQERENLVISLINMEAEEMTSALDAYFQAEQQRLDRLGDSVSPQRRMEQEVSIIAHPESNQLMVSTSPRYKSAVLTMVEQLDLPPPQVMIRVMIAEVTLDDRFNMGLEFALQELRFSETAVPGGNGVLQSSHFDVVGGTDLGAAGAGLAGFSFTITGEDFNFLVRALQADSRLEVIQRPMIMCQDNQEASINIGQQVPFVRGTQVSSTGQVTSQVEYEDVGIQLDVEPHINPDGFVYMHVVQEISAFADSTIDIGNGVLAPVFTDRAADTWVAVKDGETVVIGGLITTLENESESKVPFLGDIPGLGALFRTTSRSKQRTELLIALTPQVIRTVEDGRRMSVVERDRAGIITDNMKRSPLFENLQLQPEDAFEVEDIEAAPAGYGPEPVPQPVEPGRKYGPQAPRYGPLVPASTRVVTRRDLEPARYQETAWRVR